MSRIDIFLVDNGYTETRTRAQALIMSGKVLINGQKVTKSSQTIDKDDRLEIKEQLPYVSRGGFKLAGALDEFRIDPAGRVALDIGASTGGFTDCLLQRGLIHCYAFDVGYNQLAYKLRQDQRVKVLERINFRYYSRDDLQQVINQDIPYPDMAVIDVSFISLALILEPLFSILNTGAEVIALVKPQFEADREDVGKGGIIKDPIVWEKVLNKTKNKSVEIGYQVKAEMPSPITGRDGNREYFLYLTR